MHEILEMHRLKLDNNRYWMSMKDAVSGIGLEDEDQLVEDLSTTLIWHQKPDVAGGDCFYRMWDIRYIDDRGFREPKILVKRIPDDHIQVRRKGEILIKFDGGSEEVEEWDAVNWTDYNRRVFQGMIHYEDLHHNAQITHQYHNCKVTQVYEDRTEI